MWGEVFKNYKMYNKNNELTGQTCICIEEDTTTFFSTIIKGPDSNCCQFNSKSMTLFLSNPALFLLLHVKTCKCTDKTSLSTNIKRNLSPLKKHKRKKETQTKIEASPETNQPAYQFQRESISVLKFDICVGSTIIF